MASSSNRSTRNTNTSRGSSSRKSSGKSTSTKKINSSKDAIKRIDAKQAEQDSALFSEIGLIVLSLFMILLFFCNFGVVGPVGNGIRDIMFGIFGFLSYVMPVLVFIGVAFWFANEGNPTALRKLISGIVLVLMIGVMCELISGNVTSLESFDVKAIYAHSSKGRKGGGVLAGSLTYLLHHNLETVGTILVVLLCSVVSLILVTEKSFLGSVRSGSEKFREFSAEDAERRREAARIRREEQERIRAEREEERREREEERRLRAEEKENEALLGKDTAEEEKVPRMEKKVSGVMMATSLKKEETVHKDDIHEITYQEPVANERPVQPEKMQTQAETPAFDFDKIRVRTSHQVTLSEVKSESDMTELQSQAKPEEMKNVASAAMPLTREAEQIRVHKDGMTDGVAVQADTTASVGASTSRPAAVAPKDNGLSPAENQVHKEVQNAEKKVPRKYMFPPLSRLQKGTGSAGDSTQELKETAMRLQQTLNTFGVKVTITDISQGPSVTRYELQPEQGVKVSKIVGLTDDIKLNLAATDIRIEAPIPGKAAIGIEVPNKENMTVALRDLFESNEFKEFPSNIAFAVGKDIAGKTIVADIAKMPHMLIAGSTGSGKSVCINTLIMSILYKAHPDDVKLIMVDPKVVELSVYNGIPHLLIPVVTDPKKASAALHWAVSEMEDRYRKFADYNVRDLKGYNKKLETMRENGEEDVPSKLPQIVIIVDELADLMMVSPGEVEESICRLAQLARACGIHLIIATQRPSVDVITGLIKANMPSRVAFAVSSGVDSRTILDMVGAEKLLGKGDMLFYPQGYSKPARIQGAFVSDKEVSDVVDFLKNQMIGNTYAEDIQEKINNIKSSSPAGGGAASGGDSGRDEYFAEAGRFIIDKDKASIGMLQRVLKIGFNRAARIMDQLCEYGVVGEEEGTKPRKVLMSMEQFEQLLEEI
ncbi:MAG: DNA translocase FtsK [Lachnospiraceae bacterium]|nr:DNA translocase FtsK [Lachnospiraceae bacterium]